MDSLSGCLGVCYKIVPQTTFTNTKSQPMNEILLILGMMAVTFGVRYVPLLIVGRVTLPDEVIRALRFVPVAVLTAIVVPAMLMPQGNLELQLTNAYLVAGIVALVVSWRTKNLLLTIVVGMGFFLLWRAAFPVTPPSI